MFKEEFKERYTTIPFAFYRAERSAEHREVITHYHREIELIAMTKGTAEFYIQSKGYSLQEGDVFIIPPYALHRGYTAQGVESAYDCICFDLQLLCDKSLKDGLESRAISAVSLISGGDSCAKQLRAYIQNAVAACRENVSGWELEAVGNLSLLFGVLKKNGLLLQEHESKKETLFGERVMDYLNQNASGPITSRDAAKALYLNHSYFCRLFKKTFGYPFEKYLLNYRLEQARLYLLDTDLSVTEIAFRAGFQSCSYFGKTFKARFRATPLAYRKMKTDF